MEMGRVDLGRNKGWSAEDLALLAAVLVIVGDILAFVALVKERREKS